MTFLKTIAVAFSTYSALPMPQFPWDEQHMRYAICAFPLVGVICGTLLILWQWICGLLGCGSTLFAAVAVCIPLLVTGGIHMDGFMDTVDALASRQSRERKLEIMKDSTCGAFASLYCGVYLLLTFGLLHELYAAEKVWVLCPLYVVSRGLSAFCAVTMPSARKGGMLRAYTKDASKVTAVIVGLAAAIFAGAGMAAISLLPALGAVGCALLTVLVYRMFAMKQFGGVTGDTAGFFLQLCELTMLLGAWMGGLL